MDDPVGALIGTILIAMGTLLVYGAIKNKKIFGEKGLLPTALSTGAIANLSDIPTAYQAFGIVPNPSASVVDAGKTLAEKIIDKLTPNKVDAKWQIPVSVRDAVLNIAKTDPSLGDRIATEISEIDSLTTRNSMIVLQSSLTLATVRGHRDDVTTIKDYVRQLTGVAL